MVPYSGIQFAWIYWWAVCIERLLPDDISFQAVIVPMILAVPIVTLGYVVSRAYWTVVVPILAMLLLMTTFATFMRTRDQPMSPTRTTVFVALTSFASSCIAYTAVCVLLQAFPSVYEPPWILTVVCLMVLLAIVPWYQNRDFLRNWWIVSLIVALCTEVYVAMLRTYENADVVIYSTYISFVQCLVFLIQPRFETCFCNRNAQDGCLKRLPSSYTSTRLSTDDTELDALRRPRPLYAR